VVLWWWCCGGGDNLITGQERKKKDYAFMIGMMIEDKFKWVEVVVGGSDK